MKGILKANKKYLILFSIIILLPFLSGCGGITPTVYTITSNAEVGGSINPAGVITVTEGEDKTFTISPDADYQIADVIVDGTSMGTVTEYTFQEVTANHKIVVTFEAITTISEAYFTFDIPTRTITDYDVAGGLEVIVPFTIGGVAVEHIGDDAFYDNALTSVIIPNSVTTIGEVAFAYNNLTSITIPDSVTSIGNGVFAYNQLTSVTISNSVTTIYSDTFYSNQLISVTIPDSVTSIDRYAFAGNNLTSVTIGSDVDIYPPATTMGTNTGFKTVYDSGGKLAGTYNYTGWVWVKE